MGIESVVDEKKAANNGLNGASCTACEMAVIWMRNQLKRNKTEEQILNYVNEVNQSIKLYIVLWPEIVSLAAS